MCEREGEIEIDREREMLAMRTEAKEHAGLCIKEIARLHEPNDFTPLVYITALE